jgi:NAD(P)-dependent dehydrogenase (short-subunit alcohol dehydrogenase family)
LERDLEGKTALVAINYASSEKAARDVLEGIEAAGGEAFLLKFRLGSTEAPQALGEALDRELARRTGAKRLDILVNNVGMGDYRSLCQTGDELLDTIFTTNVFAPFKLTRALYERIADDGRVINISSMAVRLIDRDTIAYNMSKAALEMFTKTLAKDLGRRRITVNSVAPGFTETDVNAAILDDPAQVAAIGERTLLGRFATPADIADFVHALAGPAGRWVTGQCIEASGGFDF